MAAYLEDERSQDGPSGDGRQAHVPFRLDQPVLMIHLNLKQSKDGGLECYTMSASVHAWAGWRQQLGWA